ncbi:MAG: amino acid-binding protein [Deltaproteobacteria bacterium]|nr:amino acid-binding protein [Deltaproteobacteria bacterium]
MKVEQVSVFLENKQGSLEEVTRILRDANVNIRTLSLADTTDFGILRLIVNDVDTTSRALRDKGFRVSRTTVVAVEVPDKPGGLHSILEVLARDNIAVEYLYAYVEKSGENAVIIFRFDDSNAAIEVLRKNSFSVLSGDKLYSF